MLKMWTHGSSLSSSLWGAPLRLAGKWHPGLDFGGRETTRRARVGNQRAPCQLVGCHSRFPVTGARQEGRPCTARSFDFSRKSRSPDFKM